MDANPKTNNPPLYTAIIYDSKPVNYIRKSEYDALEKEAVEFADFIRIIDVNRAFVYYALTADSKPKFDAIVNAAVAFLTKHKETK